MTRPKNTVTMTKATKDGTEWDIRFNTPTGRQRIKRSTTTILKALQHYDNCLFKDDI